MSRRRIAAIDVSDMRQRQGELDQQISIVEAQVRALRTTRAVGRHIADPTRGHAARAGRASRPARIDRKIAPRARSADRAGCRGDRRRQRRGGPDRSAELHRLQHHRSVAAVGRGAELREHRTVPRRAGVDIYGENYDLIYQGTGFADRSQSVPVHFAVTGDTAGLRAGQFLTVLVATDDAKEGVAVPRSSARSRLQRPGFRLRAHQRPSGSCQGACARSLSTAIAC